MPAILFATRGGAKQSAEVFLKLHFLVMILTFMVACISDPKTDEAIARHQANLTKMEQEYKTYDPKIRDAGNDPGLRNQLIGEQALLKSRIERLKEIIAQGEKK